MGLVTGLLTLPLAPVRGAVWLIELIRTEAERRYYDPGEIRRQLELVDQARRSGELSESEAAEMEEQLLDRLLRGPGRANSTEDNRGG
jgi:hypothetical protein